MTTQDFANIIITLMQENAKDSADNTNSAYLRGLYDGEEIAYKTLLRILGLDISGPVC